MAGETAPSGRSKISEGTAWLVVSRISPNGEDKTYEKIILQTGDLNASSSILQVRELRKSERRRAAIKESKPGAFDEHDLNQPFEIAEIDNLKIILVVGNTRD